jgi:glycosyltransferase involved in cell wall biosynthesis
MKIAIDARLTQSSRVGIGEYILNLIINISKNHPEIDLFLIFHKKEKIPTLLNELKCEIYSNAPSYSDYGFREWWEHFRLPKLLELKKIDLYHSPNYYLPILLKAKCKTVVTMYDASLFAVPEYYKIVHVLMGRFIIRKSAVLADAIICGSKHAKNEFLKYLEDINPSKIKEIYIGVPESIKKIIDEKKDKINSSSNFLYKYKINNPYVIAVGSVQPRKNYQRLIEAMKDERLINYSLVICGSKAWKFTEIEKAASDLKLNGRIIITGYLENEDMIEILTNAKAMIFPSLYEGFGIPPLEAFAANIPVIASSATSIPEVVGDAAILFNPHSVTDMVNKISMVLENTKLAAQMVEKGKMRISHFNWEKCATEHVEIYRQVMAKNYV